MLIMAKAYLGKMLFCKVKKQTEGLKRAKNDDLSKSRHDRQSKAILKSSKQP